MDEEKRIITIYKDVDYDESIEKLKETLKKFDATLKSANEDELQIEIARSQLEDLCNELDLDIDDLTEEWDSYKPESQETAPAANADPQLAALVGKIDKDMDAFNPSEFFESTRQNKRNAAIRLQNEDKIYELYVDFEDKVYVEFWRIDLDKDCEDPKCKTRLVYSAEFDENDLDGWKKTENAFMKYLSKKQSNKEEHKHQPHHQLQTDSFPRAGFSAEAAMLLDDAENADSLDELNEISYLTSAALQSDRIDKDEYARIMRIIAYKESTLKTETDDACEDVRVHDYEYDIKLAEQIRDELLEGANADLPEHIDYAIASRGGEIESMRVAPDSIHVLWHLGDFNADNRIWLNSLNVGVNQLAEDIAHALWKKTNVKDSRSEIEKRLVSDLAKKIYKELRASTFTKPMWQRENLIAEHADELSEDEVNALYDVLEFDRKVIYPMYDSADKIHKVDIKNAPMKEIAQVCDIFDDAEIKYVLTNDSLTVHCGPSQWKELQARFKLLQGE